MTTYNATKICYKYDKETYKYAGMAEATLNLARTAKTGVATYDFPNDDSTFYTFVEPPVVDDTRTPIIEEHETLVFNTMFGDWSTQVAWRTGVKLTPIKPSEAVFSDINVRLIDYEKDKFLTEDAKAVFQSIYRLFTTEEGEIPYYRAYGCKMKRFIQYPLTQGTANSIYNYLKEKVEMFEPRGQLISSEVYANPSDNTLCMKIWVQCKATGETGVLPDLFVKVNRNRK